MASGSDPSADVAAVGSLDDAPVVLTVVLVVVDVDVDVVESKEKPSVKSEPPPQAAAINAKHVAATVATGANR